MNDIYVQFLLLLRSVWLRRWYALAVAWLVTLGGWAYVSNIPDKYESSAQIYIDTDTMLKDLLRGVTVSVDVNRQVQVMQKTLFSRPNMERVVRMADLDLNATTESQISGLVGRLQGNVKLSPLAPNLFRLSYEDGNPQVAKRVVQSLLTIFVESNLGRSRQDISQARRFLDEQIRDYERQLAEAEQRRAQFRRENMGLLPGEGNYYNRMQHERGLVLRLRRELHEAELTRNELYEHLQTVPKYVAIRTAGADGDNYTSLQRVSDLRRRLAEYDANGFTDMHPDVVSTQESLEKALEQHEAEQEALLANPEQNDQSPLNPNATMLNPVWEQVQVKIVDAETAVAKLQSQIRNQEAMIAELDGLAKSVPGIEAELIRLDRDYNVLKGKFEDLLTRRESARIAQDLEGTTDKVQFRVIEPPELPSRPSSPNRAALLSVSLLVGLAAGLGVAFLLGQLHHTFSTANRLRSTFDLPVLGTISAVAFDTYSRRRRIEITSFSIILICLVVFYVFLITYGAGPLPYVGSA